MNQRQLIKGAFFLILAGFLSRFIGFFYRIYLSNTIGAKNLGLYQLIFPIYSICYTIYASGIQTAISKIAASKLKNKNKHTLVSPFLTGASLSLFLSLLMSTSLYISAPFIASYLLKEPSCTTSLRILSMVFPFCGLTACANGFYYAINKTGIPSISQLIEQITRVSIVFIFCSIFNFTPSSCNIAVVSLVIGEFISCIFMFFALIFNKTFSLCFKSSSHKSFTDYFYSYKKLITYTIPLTLNKLLISILNSIEAILIPIMLTKYGLSHNESLVIYGVLTGMSMSFIMFPSAITNSLSVVLLPSISAAKAEKKDYEIQTTVSQTFHYTFIIGLLSLAIFSFWGKDIGLCVFNNSSAGNFIKILAWLCPFMYLTTTLSSVLNGLGKTTITFRNSLLSSILKLLFVLIIIPQLGIYGYLLGILFSSIFLFILDLFSINKYISISINFKNTIIKPAIITLCTGFTLNYIYKYICLNYTFSKLILLLLTCTSFLLIYLLTLLKLKIISLKLR